LHGDDRPLARDNLQESAGKKAFDFQQGFVSFYFKEDVPFGDGITHLLAPLDDLDRLFRLP
jgi:hypothetical protein